MKPAYTARHKRENNSIPGLLVLQLCGTGYLTINQNYIMMKRIFLILVLFVSGISLLAQPVMKLSKTDHDFGTFKEEDGRQRYDFVVMNTGDQPLVIKNIVASCGCTTPEWTKSPIAPSGTGKISAIYDPVNRPGAFNKTLSVYTNSKPELVVLVIKGEVVPREKTIEEIYTFAVGNVRFESNHLAFTNIKKNEKKIRVMTIINNSDTPATIGFDKVPEHLAIKAEPETLKPGQKGIIQGTYDANKNQGWGNVSDLVRVKINGVVQDKVYFYVSANLVEDFSGLSKEDMANAPVFKVASTTVDLGKMPGASTRDVEFSFTNEGKSDLVIRHIRSTCGCTAIQEGSQGIGIKPGQQSSIKATFNSGSYKGKTTKAIYVYTNDPKNSEVVLMLNADVEQKAVAN